MITILYIAADNDLSYSVFGLLYTSFNVEHPVAEDESLANSPSFCLFLCWTVNITFYKSRFFLSIRSGHYLIYFTFWQLIRSFENRLNNITKIFYDHIILVYIYHVFSCIIYHWRSHVSVEISVKIHFESKFFIYIYIYIYITYRIS